MTFDEAKTRVEEIHRIANVERDDEKAHSHEARLYVDVLNYIAEGNGSGYEAAELAAIALEADKLSFNRRKG